MECRPHSRAVAVGALVLIIAGCGDSLQLPLVPLRPPSDEIVGPGTWEALEPMAAPRWQIGATALAGLVYVVGGVTPDGLGYRAVPEILAYDPAENTWETVGRLFQPIRAPGVAALGELIYVVGGHRDDPWEPAATLQIFDPRAGTVVIGPPMSMARGGVAAVVVDGRFHAIGGVSADWDPVMGDPVDRHEVFDPATGKWSDLAPLPKPRIGHGAAVLDGKVYVAGGWEGGWWPSLDVYDPATDSWASHASPAGRFDAAVAALGGKVYVFGGARRPEACCDGPIASPVVERFDPAAAKWEAVAGMPTRRSGHGVAVVDDAVYVIAGNQSDTPFVVFSTVNERITWE